MSASESTVLDSTSTIESNRWGSYGKPKIIEFNGFEGEDFRHFLHILESFYALNGITHDARKVAIMRAQLRRVASVYSDSMLKERNTTLSKVSYSESVNILKNHFVSAATIEFYQNAFDEMTQSKGKSPSEFLSRLYEGADLANISDEKFIFSRFKTALSIDIKIKHSSAWWNAHSIKTIHLVDNPFNSGNIYNPNGNNGKNLNLKPVNSEEMSPSNDVFFKPNPKLAKEAYASPMCPLIASLTAKMKALELHSLIPNTSEKGQIDSSVIRGNAIKSYYPDQDYYQDRYYQDRRGQDRRVISVNNNHTDPQNNNGSYNQAPPNGQFNGNTDKQDTRNNGSPQNDNYYQNKKNAQQQNGQYVPNYQGSHRNYTDSNGQGNARKNAQNNRLSKPPDLQISPGDNKMKNDQAMNIDPQFTRPELLIQPFAPKIAHSNMPKPVKSTTRNTALLSKKISYDVNEILERKAGINVKDLLTVAPTVKREFPKAIKSHTAVGNDKALPLNFFEDDDVDTTAIYTYFYINDVHVKSMLETGSAKNCMSKDAANKLQLAIDSPSTSVFTLGNGTKQPSLGIVYDVTLNLGGNFVIPGSVEVLPICLTN
ncbi:hypothetical protein [Parasitella parasitica]|uniref:Uncharacterized protein n=1 Tax=Parasitella parasitica TaxID=35722 RepID=A0A0B7MSX0_9FUNG|nr:hypothetical protein [Parasitella parasitica]